MNSFISKHSALIFILAGLIPLTAYSKESPPATSNSPSSNSSAFANFDKEMRYLDARMDSIFADTFRDLGDWFDNSLVATSVDLREQNGNYVARVYVPSGNTSKADVKIDKGVLHVALNDERTINGKTEPEHFEQVINFPKPVESDKMRVERKKDLIVVTVPKQTNSTPAIASTPAATPTTSESQPGTQATNWEDSILKDFAQVQNQMDQVVREIFPNNPSIGTATSQLESAVNLDDQKDKYVVHFYLPNRNTSNVSIDYKDGQLDLIAKEQQNTQQHTASGSMQSSATGRYEEMVTLPGPVKDKDMTVNRQAGQVVVTLPKA